MKVTGNIFDENMKFLPNTNIEVIGENIFTSADDYGQFEINVKDENSQLKFSHASKDFDTISVKEFNKLGYIQLYNHSLDDVLFSSTKNKDNSLLIILAIIAVGIAIKIGLKKKPLKVKV